MYHALSVVLRHPGTDTVTWLASREHHRWLDIVEMWSPAGRNPESFGCAQDSALSEVECAERARRGGGVEGLGTEQDGVGSLREAVRRLVTALDTVSIPEWAQEHERVFGHSVQSAAPPYELEYGEEHSHRQPQELGDIAAFYQAFGLRVASTSHERVDHIVTECEFMQYLLYKQACALDEGSQERASFDSAQDARPELVEGRALRLGFASLRASPELVEGRADLCEAAARQFLADHLGRWGPACCLRLSRAAEQGILGAVAEATLAWLAQDCQRLGISAGSRDLPLRLPKERDEVGCAACAPQQPGSADGPTCR